MSEIRTVINEAIESGVNTLFLSKEALEQVFQDIAPGNPVTNRLRLNKDDVTLICLESYEEPTPEEMATYVKESWAFPEARDFKWVLEPEPEKPKDDLKYSKETFDFVNEMRKKHGYKPYDEEDFFK